MNDTDYANIRPRPPQIAHAVPQSDSGELTNSPLLLNKTFAAQNWALQIKEESARVCKIMLM